MFAVVKGATLLTPSGSFSQPNLKHLTILLTNPVGPAKQVLTVTVSTIRGSNYDRTCVLDKGDHSFINGPSFVAYWFCRHDCTEKAIHEAIANDMFVPMEPLREEVFDRVVAGLHKSPHTAPFAKTFIR